MSASHDKERTSPGLRFGHGNGWLDPRGGFYPLTAVNQHCEWCNRNMRRSCRSDTTVPGCRREREGWFKLTNDKWILASPSRITRPQYDFIVDWHLHNQKDLREFNLMVDDCWQGTPREFDPMPGESA